jgi:hypothetical protein
VYQQKVAACDIRIEAVLEVLSSVRGRQEGARTDKSGSPKRRGSQTANEPAFDVGQSLHTLLGNNYAQLRQLRNYVITVTVHVLKRPTSARSSASRT